MKPLVFIVALSLALLSCQSNRSIITGKLVGDDGMPMPLAHVQLAGAIQSPAGLHELNDPVLVTQQVREDGMFAISTEERGPLVLVCTGVGHLPLRIPLPLEAPADVSIDIRLACAFPDTSQSEILIVTSTDGGATTQSQYLSKQADGSFRADFPTDGDSISYMVYAAGPDSWATSLIGATAFRYGITSEMDYVAVVPVVNGHSTVEYHMPSRATSEHESVRFSDTSATLATFARLQLTFAQHIAAANSAMVRHLRSGMPLHTFTYPWIEFADSLAQIASETSDRLLKDELALEVLECYEKAHKSINDRKQRKLIAGVAPTSLGWVYHGTLGLATQKIPEMGTQYFASIVDKHPWRNYASYLLFYQCVAAKQVRDDSQAREILARLTKDFGDTPASRKAQESYAPRDVIRAGSLLPRFAFRSADDSTVVFSNETFRGKHLLLIFWGPWCSPCVAEMPALHKAYEKYRKAGLEMLSVAISTEPGRLARFRKVSWPMPWSVALVSRDSLPIVSRRFAVSTPKHILVDPAGRIVMVDSTLYGNQLDPTLARFLEESTDGHDEH